MSGSTSANDLAIEFVTLNNYLGGGGLRTSAMQRLVELATASIPGCEWAAITSWPADRRPSTLSHTGDVAAAVDQLQYDFGEGPCLTASTADDTVHIENISTERRWPDFCRATQSRTPVRAVLSFHLGDHPDRSALNLYAQQPGAFTTDAITTGALFAAHARVLVLHAASAANATNLSRALSTSRQIGAAIGILMNTHKITDEQAFDMLRTASQHLNRKLHDIADDVTQTGTLPDLP